VVYTGSGRGPARFGDSKRSTGCKLTNTSGKDTATQNATGARASNRDSLLLTVGAVHSEKC